MPTIRSEPCKNCEVEVYLERVAALEPRDVDWIWTHVPVALRRSGAGEACATPEPRRRSGAMFRVGPGEL